ncbi:putative fatty acyl-CoA reductase CG5065 [Nilaparvata lugens]|uniref:Fatty acyl-CoA reductase n=1 Tax=Nilaparvata lugens TaxID=108931 RepID=A0A3Q8G632_NILLU|nr:putative fatty acyl-CoA reductase CG5065 [Nilaparvata lugens]AWJ25032.1 fatty acyl-CoA reductase [Nilaparvata lugens]
MSNQNNDSPTKEFYNGRYIFVTGGTGFIGKVLLHKLLVSCPQIERIYLLLRNRRDTDSISSRLSNLWSSPALNYLEQLDPKYKDKIVPVSGDLSKPQLGIGSADLINLKNQISIVFHLAATIKFDETLKNSVTINMLGTKRLLELCRDMEKLEALVYVSTAFSNCDRFVINEMLYPSKYDPEHVIKCTQWMDDETLKVITPLLLGKHPNTYTFTKAMAENILRTDAAGIPTAIVRPSVILSSVQEPFPGWLDNFNGPNRLIAMCSQGLSRSVICDKTKQAEVVPVDFVVNVIVCAAWRIATTRPKEIVVYNFCSSQLNPINFETFVSYSLKSMKLHPSEKIVFNPNLTLYKSKMRHNLLYLLFNKLPALVLDTLILLKGKRPYLADQIKRMTSKMECLEFFLLNDWHILDCNVQSLNLSLTPKDRDEFPFDVTLIDWEAYINNYVLGVRKFLLKEKDESLPVATKRLRRIMTIYWLVKSFCIIFFVLKIAQKSSFFTDRLSSLLLYLIKLLRMFRF